MSLNNKSIVLHYKRVSFHNTVVEQTTHMWMCAGSNPISVNHCEDIVQAIFCEMNRQKKKKEQNTSRDMLSHSFHPKMWEHVA